MEIKILLENIITCNAVLQDQMCLMRQTMVDRRCLLPSGGGWSIFETNESKKYFKNLLQNRNNLKSKIFEYKKINNVKAQARCCKQEVMKNTKFKVFPSKNKMLQKLKIKYAV